MRSNREVAAVAERLDMLQATIAQLKAERDQLLDDLHATAVAWAGQFFPPAIAGTLAERHRLPQVVVDASPFGPEYDLPVWSVHQGRVVLSTIGHLTAQVPLHDASLRELMLAQNLCDVARQLVRVREQLAAHHCE